MDESDSLRQFIIPKRRASASENLIAIDQNSFEYKSDVLNVIQQHFKHKDSLEYFSFRNPHVVQNPVLLTEFNEKRKQMKEVYNDKELKFSYAFLHLHSKYEAERICKEGLYIGNSDVKSLGDPNLGVYVSKYADIVSDQMSYGYLVIFKLIKGKVKTMVENKTGDALEPTPGCDCHVAKPSNHSDEYEAAQIYVFEYDNNMEVLRRPRHLLPFAMVYFSMYPRKSGQSKPYKPNRSVKPPAWALPFVKGNENEMNTQEILPPKKSSQHSMSFHHSQPHLLWTGSMIINNRITCSVNIYSDYLIACPFYLGADIKLNSEFKTDMLFSLLFIDKLPTLKIKEFTVWNGIYYTYTKMKCTDSMAFKFMKVANDLQDNDSSLLCSVDDSVKLVLVPNCKQIEKLGLHDPSYLHAIFISNCPNIYAPKSDYKDSLKQIVERISLTMPRPIINKSDPRQMKKMMTTKGSLSDWGDIPQFGTEEVFAPIAPTFESWSNIPMPSFLPVIYEVQPNEIIPNNDNNEAEQVAEPIFVPLCPHPLPPLMTPPLPVPPVVQIDQEESFSGPVETTDAQQKLNFDINLLRLSLRTLKMPFIRDNWEISNDDVPLESAAIESAVVESTAVELPVIESAAIESAVIESAAVESAGVESAAVKLTAIESAALASATNKTSILESTNVEWADVEFAARDQGHKDVAEQGTITVLDDDLSIYCPERYDAPVIIDDDDDDDDDEVAQENDRDFNVEYRHVGLLKDNWGDDDFYQDDNNYNDQNDDDDGLSDTDRQEVEEDNDVNDKIESEANEDHYDEEDVKREDVVEHKEQNYEDEEEEDDDDMDDDMDDGVADQIVLQCIQPSMLCPYVVKWDSLQHSQKNSDDEDSKSNINAQLDDTFDPENNYYTYTDCALSMKQELDIKKELLDDTTPIKQEFDDGPESGEILTPTDIYEEYDLKNEKNRSNVNLISDDETDESSVIIVNYMIPQQRGLEPSLDNNEDLESIIYEYGDDGRVIFRNILVKMANDFRNTEIKDDLCDSKRNSVKSLNDNVLGDVLAKILTEQYYQNVYYQQNKRISISSSEDEQDDEMMTARSPDNFRDMEVGSPTPELKERMMPAEDYFPSPVRYGNSATWESFLAMFLGNNLSVDPEKDHTAVCEIPDGGLSDTFQNNSAPRFYRPVYVYKASLEDIQNMFDGVSGDNEDQSYQDGLAYSINEVRFYEERKKCVKIMDEWISIKSPSIELKQDSERVCKMRWFQCLHKDCKSKVTLPSVEKTYHDFVASRFFLGGMEDEVSRSGIPFLEDVEEGGPNCDQMGEFPQIFKEFEDLNWSKHWHAVELPPKHHSIQRKVFKDASNVLSLEIHTSKDPRLSLTCSSDSIYWPLTNRITSSPIKSKKEGTPITHSFHKFENVHITIYQSLNHDTVSSNTVNSYNMDDISLPNLTNIKPSENNNVNYKPELKHLPISHNGYCFQHDPATKFSKTDFDVQNGLKINRLENATDIGIPCIKSSVPEVLSNNFHNNTCFREKEMFPIQNAKLLSFQSELQDETLNYRQRGNSDTSVKIVTKESSPPIFVNKTCVSSSKLFPLQTNKINGCNVQNQKENYSYKQKLLNVEVKCGTLVSKNKYYQKFKSLIKFTHVCKSCKKFFISKYLRSHASISQHTTGNKDKFVINAILSLMCFTNPQEKYKNNSYMTSKFLAYFKEIPLNRISSVNRNYFNLEKAVGNTARRVQKKNLLFHNMYLSALALNYNSRNLKIDKNRQKVIHWRQENTNIDSIIHRSLTNFNGEVDKILNGLPNGNSKANDTLCKSIVSLKKISGTNHFVNLSHFCTNSEQLETSFKRKFHKVITSSEHAPQTDKIKKSSNQIPSVDQNCEIAWKKIKLNRHSNLNSKMNNTSKTIKLTATGGKLVHSRTTSSYLPDFLKMQSRTSVSPICKVSSSDEITSNPYGSLMVDYDIQDISVCSTAEVSNESPEHGIASTTSNDELSVCGSAVNIPQMIENNRNQNTINSGKTEIVNSFDNSRPIDINHHYTVLNICGPPLNNYQPFYQAHTLRPAFQYPWNNMVLAVPNPPPFMAYPVRQAIPFCNSFIPPPFPGFYRYPPQFRHKNVTPAKIPHASNTATHQTNMEVRMVKNQTSDPPKYQKSTSFSNQSKRIYVFNKDRSLSHNIEKFLQFKGALTFDPFNIVMLRNVPNIQCFVLIHFQDLNKLDKIPNILQLKRDLRVQFVVYKDVNDVKYQKFELIFPKGGVLIMEDDTFLTFKANVFQKLCESLKKQIDENTKPWKLILNGTIKDILKETKGCSNYEAQNRKSLLTVMKIYEESGLIHFSHFNLISQSQKLEEYLSNCLDFQSSYCSEFRHFLFLTEKKVTSKDSLKFTNRGIDILTISSFARGFLSISIKISTIPALARLETSCPEYSDAILSTSVITL